MGSEMCIRDSLSTSYFCGLGLRNAPFLFSPFFPCLVLFKSPCALHLRNVPLPGSRTARKQGTLAKPEAEALAWQFPHCLRGTRHISDQAHLYAFAAIRALLRAKGWRLFSRRLFFCTHFQLLARPSLQKFALAANSRPLKKD